MEIKCITVIGKNGKQLPSCTKKRAVKLIERQRAEWSGYNIIKLLVDKDDRKKIRQEVISRDKGICYICGKITENPTMDHVQARNSFIKKGGDSLENWKCACNKCNEAKSNYELKDFVNMIEKSPLRYEWIPKDRIPYLKSLITKLN